MSVAALAGAALVVFALAATGCGGVDSEGSARPRLVVSGASSMTEALGSCSRDFPGATVRLSFAGSDDLAAQIRQGVKPDVFAAANTRLPADLHEEGLLGSPVEFATNELVLAVPSGSEIDSLEDLTGEDVTIALGSESVPVGSYTRKALAKLPASEERAILDNVRSNEPEVKGIVGKLTQGAADAGFVYLTDVNATDGGLEAVALPRALEPHVTYGAGVVDGARQQDEARAFVQGLLDGPCAASLADAGFGPAP